MNIINKGNTKVFTDSTAGTGGSGGFSGTPYTDTATVSGATYTLTNTPTFIFGVYKDGQFLTVTGDYTVAANIITFGTVLSSDLITVIYKY